MFCTVCGTPFGPGAMVCGKCGAALQGGAPPPPPQVPAYLQHAPPPMMPPVYASAPPATRVSGLSIAGFVLSFFGGLAVLGLIFSAIGLSECNRSNGTVTGKGFAIAGLVISIFWVLIFAGFATGFIRASHLF